MTDERAPRRASVVWLSAGSVVLCLGVAFAVVSGAAVVKNLWFVDEAVQLEAPGRYLVKAARASTWTLLQELSPAGELSAMSVKVRGASRAADVVVGPSAAAYRYSRDGVTGFSAYDFRVPEAGEYEVELSSNAGVTVRLVDDVAGRLLDARRGLVRTAAVAGGALALSLALFMIAYLVPKRRARVRVMAPSTRPSAPRRTPVAAPARKLQVLPALSTSVALERYGAPAPKKPAEPRARARQGKTRVPSVA